MSPIPSQRDRLRKVSTFPSLVKYLREELDWPIGSDDFEDLTFDYTPEEIGLDAATAAKIDEIKRLRPLTATQPWGIFFVKFEPKRLPVVALRRILNRVVTKNRASANPSAMPSWEMANLMLISSYGEGGNREISFAHFTQPEEGSRLPPLKVLGWDSRDTPLHLDHVADVLAEQLTWPDDEENTDTWLEQWRSAFTLSHREVITTSQMLSVELAKLARNIRDRINTALTIESEDGPLTTMFAVFRDALIHDLEPDEFADMYAQTIAYGLLASRIATPTSLETSTPIATIPIISPFLKELMGAFLEPGETDHKSGSATQLDFDELGVTEIVELLDSTNMEAVVRDFGDKNPLEDPVIHFYELFLGEYDAQLKIERGVFYTPRPVVSFIVRSLDELLRTEFGLEDGLADTTTWGEMARRIDNLEIPEGAVASQAFVQILDPATGTGTFLVEVINLVHQTMTDKWHAEGHGSIQHKNLWNDYVSEHLLPRLTGYELLMAPYAIAHLKIGLKLHETGYSFRDSEPVGIYLTNALEPAQDFSGVLDFAVPALAHEAQSVNAIKQSRPFTVVLGNPPYSGVSSNMNAWIDGLLKGELPDGTQVSSYYEVDGQPLGERKVWLQDDYVKFIRLSQWLLDRSGCGIHGFITNHGYLDNPTFRGLRWSLRQSFDHIKVLDLHGNVRTKERSPDGSSDSNVFDIQQGTAIGLFTKGGNNSDPPDLAQVQHAEMWGTRAKKYNRLLTESITNIECHDLESLEPFFLFEPYEIAEADAYYSWPPINEVFPVNVTGIITARDHFVIDFDAAAIKDRIAVLGDESVSDQEIRERFFTGRGSTKYPSGDSRGWKLPQARQKVQDDPDWKNRCVPIFYRPFDKRQIYYVPWMVDWPRPDVMPHLLGRENLALITCRRQSIAADEWSRVSVTDSILVSSAISNASGEVNYAYPLYLYTDCLPSESSLWQGSAADGAARIANLDPEYVESISRATSLVFDQTQPALSATKFGPECVFHFIYAVFHSPTYRKMFDAALKLDFPRTPVPGSQGLFERLGALGSKLVSLHLLVSPSLDTHVTSLIGSGDFQVEKVSYSGDTVWIDKAKTQGFRGVPQEVWDFKVGLYQVCEKWLKDRQAVGGENPRPGRVLTDDDVEHYQKIIVALTEIIRVMDEIDKSIEAHGGWPDAFSSV